MMSKLFNGLFDEDTDTASSQPEKTEIISIFRNNSEEEQAAPSQTLEDVKNSDSDENISEKVDKAKKAATEETSISTNESEETLLAPQTETEEAVKEETVQEDTPKPKKTKSVSKPGRSRKTAEKKDEDVKKEDEDVIEEDNVVVYNAKYSPGSVDFDIIQNKLIPSPKDDKWDEVKADIEKDLEKLHIDTNIQIGALKILLTTLPNIYARVRPLKAEYDCLLDSLTNKVTGLIIRQQNINSGGLGQLTARKKKAFASPENFKLEGTRSTINLYDYEIVIRYRREWLQSVMDQLENKKSCMIGLLSIMKVENN